jgi:MFS transporter, SP family, general alpha glucoside:H+ symporter
MSCYASRARVYARPDDLYLGQSIFAESFATRWDHWLVAKLLSGMGVGMLQATLPFYISEISPTQLRGFLINAYTL